MNVTDEKFAGFDGIVTDIAQVTEVIGEPMPQVLVKVVDRLDSVCRDYIAASSFCLIASADPNGPIDISPKGARSKGSMDGDRRGPSR